MSAFLERFRSTDTRRFIRTFGVAGTLMDSSGGSTQITGIDRDPYLASTPAGMAIENDTPAIWFITSQLPADGVVGCHWYPSIGAGKEITSQEPNQRTGLTRCNLTDL